MFLNRLSNEQKELFLDLCIHASKSNEDFSDEEKLTLEQYCEEMHIEVRFDEKAGFEEAASKLLDISTDTELRIIMLETAALLISDNSYDEQEQSFFESLSAKLGMDKAAADEVMDVVRNLTAIYERIGEFVFG